MKPALLLAALSLLLPADGVALEKKQAAARNGVVVNIAPDGSAMQILEPWELASWGYLEKSHYGITLHTFRKGPVVAELSVLRARTTGKDSADMTRKLADGYSKRTGRTIEPRPIFLANGLVLNVIESINKIDGRRQYVWEGYLKQNMSSPLAYYYIVACPADKATQEEFRAAAADSLRVLGTLKF